MLKMPFLTPIWKSRRGCHRRIAEPVSGPRATRNRLKWLWVGCLFLLGWPGFAEDARAERIERRFVDGTIVLEFDPARIEKSVLSEYLVIHPIAYESQFRIANPLWQCIEGDPRYLPCGTRDFHVPHFLINAQENLRQSRARLDQLKQLNAYLELEPLVEYFVASLRFEIWKAEQLLLYYREWDEDILEEDYGELPVTKATRSVIERLRRSDDKAYKWELSRVDWGNAVNHLYRKRERDIPKKVWYDFIKTLGVTEIVKFDEIK